MVEALIFWVLAVYGALTMVRQSVRSLQRRTGAIPHPLTIILIVQNMENQIEGTLRTLMLRTALGHRERRILVFDVASQDDTGCIVQRMTNSADCVDYVRVADDVELLRQLQTFCLQSPHVGCIYDLRVTGMLQDVTRDVAWLCQ
ncbi:hypothetical protein GCM10025857_26480 [Alicyclobacillus contaminans]|uniref:hypothetical protein n=1 Tax=Alicyclobacillus contaminans TaxID=392016 RepID=UPI000417DD9B|nr:hypothetical protein [Alicyclobacillus contaminans]GMA51291.1 hypothetical protein GCM10025857_26480 [Alicyclobacillus contaminans]